MASSLFKYSIVWSGVFLFRLLPWRPPNVEPMLAAVIPFSKRYGIFGSFTFGFLGIVLYDAVTSGWGSWTWITAISYGLLGIASHYYFSSRDMTRTHLVTFGTVATIAYDAVTGLLPGPVLLGQSFSLALSGQIPFTILHLLGTILFSVALSPSIYYWIVQNESLELSKLWMRALLITKSNIQ